MSKKIVKILGVRLDCVKRSFVMSDVADNISYGKKLFLSTPNPEILLASRKNKEFFDVLNSTYLNLTDGMGIIWASYFLKISNENGKFFVILKWFWSLILLVFYEKKLYEVVPERITGVDFMYDFCGVCAKKGFSVFLLGAADGVADETAEILMKKFNGLNVVGTYAGYPTAEYEERICNMVNDSGADVLFVAYGAPKQELWIARNFKKLNFVKMAIGIGGSFDFISGNVKRAPKMMRKFGLEWLFRLVMQPKRWRRIFNALVVFPVVILMDCLRRS